MNPSVPPTSFVTHFGAAFDLEPDRVADHDRHRERDTVAKVDDPRRERHRATRDHWVSSC
jgi:hypothetical protein